MSHIHIGVENCTELDKFLQGKHHSNLHHLCVCVGVYFNASLIHEYDLVFNGSLVIVIHLLLSPVMAKLLSDFHSHQESL